MIRDYTDASTSEEVVQKVQVEVEKQLAQLERKEMAEKALSNSKAIVVADAEKALVPLPGENAAGQSAASPDQVVGSLWTKMIPPRSDMILPFRDLKRSGPKSPSCRRNCREIVG